MPSCYLLYAVRPHISVSKAARGRGIELAHSSESSRDSKNIDRVCPFSAQKRQAARKHLRFRSQPTLFYLVNYTNPSLTTPFPQN